MNIPLLDLKSHFNSLKDELLKAINQTIETQQFILGPEVKNFEQEVAVYLNCKHAIGVTSGTDALLIALMAVDIRPDDEVIVPDYSFFATAGVVSRLNAKPVFCDIDPLTFNIDTAKIRKLITKKTKAIIPVHLFGQCADMDEIMKIAKEFNLKVIEDAAQAIGSQYKDGRNAGTIGNIGCFSFFPSKNLGCFGDGGLVTTNDDILAEKLRILRVHGSKPKYHHKIIGGNFRLDSIQASVLRVKLPHLNKWSQGRRNNAEIYNKLFIEKELATETGLTAYDKKNKVLLPKAMYRDCKKSDGSEILNYHIYNQYVIRVEKRDELKEYLKSKGIGSEVYYPVPFHIQECYANYNLSDSDYPVSNNSAKSSLALPVYPELTKEQIQYVVDAISDFFK